MCVETNSRARHWINAKNRDDLDLSTGAENFVGDRGRSDFPEADLDEKCANIQDTLHACTILETRKKCPWACGIYLESSYYEDTRFSGPEFLEID